MNPAWRLLDHTAPGWPAELQRLYAELAAAGAALVPAYFVQTTFVRMGGRVAAFAQDDGLRAAALLFPRAIVDGACHYTLRLHALGPLPPDEALLAAIEPLLPGRVLIHRPERAPAPTATHRDTGGFDLGAPAAGELRAIRELRAAIWGFGADDSFPDDLHSPAFAPATSLVARRDGQLTGFLLGFFRFGLPALERLALPYRLDLAVESQTMGVAPEWRRFGLAATLKREQARQTLDQGLDLIHWTADPLQYPNAVLNFGKLRAVAGEFMRAFYPYQNALNRVHASRLGIAWLPRSARGAAGLHDLPRVGAGLDRFPGCAILNAGPRPLALPADDAPHLALEIPADWTALQAADPTLALAWRTATDDLLERHLGYAPGRYVVGDAVAEGERRYLVAHRFTPELLGLSSQ
jgi:predicted GNAT superfamily acetyltransferase